MGYRSEVAYTIRFKDEASYRLFIAEAKSKPETAGCFKSDEASVDECECDDARWAINFYADQVKWYPSYPEVAMHEALIAQAREWDEGDTHVAIKEGDVEINLIEHRLGYIFLRIGEESNDIEEQYGGDYEWDWMQVSRQIVMDWR